MDEEKKMELTEGSVYKITSLGGRDTLLETEGVFKGFISIGVDETGLLMELSHNHGENVGKIRIVPLHVILLIDVIETKENQKKDDYKGMAHYVG
ncbi:MAG: hypothetical protein JSW62_00145 [Thermoplasmatales archaeon]|nr:MAG: hypothetical protein JSW62_00145 [Thermoplasmatales archaeon]